MENIYENNNNLFKGEIPAGVTAWKSPSNIALVKYWGKRPVQLPGNPSVSFTLNNAVTETKMKFSPKKGDDTEITFLFEGKRNMNFEKRTRNFFNLVSSLFPFIKQLDFEIDSTNSFPHSAGIASSASGMSALALCLCDIERKYFNRETGDSEFFKKASYVARLGSGSASRSLFGGITVWGETGVVPGSSDYYAIPVEDVNPLFEKYRDTILIVDAGAKKVSSRAGHSLMNNNPYARIRYKQAEENVKTLIAALKNGDTDTFVNIVEQEALTLHALMMTSNPYFLLMKPSTISIIEKITGYRDKTGIPVAFTLDAGPNVHLLYPGEYYREVKGFVESQLQQYLKNGTHIDDKVGYGPAKIDL